MPKLGYRQWCADIHEKYPGSNADILMNLAEQEMLAHDDAAKLFKNPKRKYHTRRSFYDCIGGMRQIGSDIYHTYSDFTPHVLNKAGSFFLFPVIREGCQRYGRIWITGAPSIGDNVPVPRTPQEWKWGPGPNRMLQTPRSGVVIDKDFALQLVSPGVYSVFVDKGRGSKRALILLLTVRTHLSNSDFRRYMFSLEGKIDLMTKVRNNRSFGLTVIVPTPAVSIPASLVSAIP
jgi:hypothetical protein